MWLVDFRIPVADEQYKKEFENELVNFKARIVRRAQEKLDAAIKEIEETEKQKRLGPGGLDPVEVYESLPPVNETPNVIYLHLPFFLSWLSAIRIWNGKSKQLFIPILGTQYVWTSSLR